MDYSEQLKDPRWIQRREEIIRRDFGMCQICMSSKNLQVHHKVYIKDRMAWDYADPYLMTLCTNCHRNFHLHNSDIKILEKGDPMIEGFYNIARDLKSLRRLDSIISAKDKNG